MELDPSGRQVLTCPLYGDGDKQVAARLSMSPYTVNQHTKAICRNFGVRSRAELLAPAPTASGRVIPPGRRARARPGGDGDTNRPLP